MEGPATELKRLRMRAKPRISVRAIAELLGMSPPTYHRYESEKGFKQRYLPMDLARKIARVLADRGVNPDDVLRLAGIQEGEGTPATLTVGEEKLLDCFRELDADRRELLLQVAAAFSTATPKSATLHELPAGYRREPHDRP
jgi:transcriptional regulator with XRE-family HTH domain